MNLTTKIMKHFAQILPGRSATDCTAAFQYGCALLALLGTAWPAMSAPDFKPEAQVSQIKVQPDKAPDCTTLKSIVESVTRDCRSNDEKAIALYNFMQLTHYHRNYPSEPGGIPVLKEINTYGWSLCGGLHSEQSALWRELGWGWRFVGWNGHTTVEAQYDNQWHYLDVFLKFYAWKPEASVNVAGLEPGNYKIEFFSTATGEVVGSDSQPVRPLRHFGYGIELKPPPFWGDIAARIIRQGQQWKKE